MVTQTNKFEYSELKYKCGVQLSNPKDGNERNLVFQFGLCHIICFNFFKQFTTNLLIFSRILRDCEIVRKSRSNLNRDHIFCSDGQFIAVFILTILMVLYRN